MKLVIASDIHGAADACERLMALVATECPDRIVLLGDLLYHGPRNDLPTDYAPKRVIEMLNSVADRVIAVRGNCEAEVDQMVLGFPCMADHNVLLDRMPRAAPSRSSSRTATSTAPAATTASTPGPHCRPTRRWSTVTPTSR